MNTDAITPSFAPSVSFGVGKTVLQKQASSMSQQLTATSLISHSPWCLQCGLASDSVLIFTQDLGDRAAWLLWFHANQERSPKALMWARKCSDQEETHITFDGN